MAFVARAELGLLARDLEELIVLMSTRARRTCTHGVVFMREGHLWRDTWTALSGPLSFAAVLPLYDAGRQIPGRRGAAYEGLANDPW